MKIGLIISNNYWSSPFVKIYEEILIEQSIQYDIISWDRDGTNDNGVVSFKLIQSLYTNKFIKLLAYIKFRSFIINVINDKKYDKLVIFDSQIGLLLYPYLKKRYHKKFVFDYRDISIDQYFKRRFQKLLFLSDMIVISSPGFKRVLPDIFDYIISHNISKEALLSEVDVKPPFIGNKTIISNIGLIRDIEVNMELVEAFKNKNDILLKFVGKDSDKIQKLTKDTINVECYGFYNKEDEIALVTQTDFIYLYFPNSLNYSINLANRFYKALICKRPLIVRANTFHADLVIKYKLGIAIDNCSELEQKMYEYIEEFDFISFINSCDLLIKEIILDYNNFKSHFTNFLNRT